MGEREMGAREETRRGGRACGGPAASLRRAGPGRPLGRRAWKGRLGAWASEWRSGRQPGIRLPSI